ncbi:MAG: hypothetical protein ACKOBC_08815 [Hyphomicrobiales bacterium]
MWQTVLGTIFALILVGLLLRQYVQERARREAEPGRIFADALPVLENSEARAGAQAGSYLLTGRYQGHEVQVKVLADTLALRKLPGLWLMVTLPTPIPLNATLDLMMRPAGATSFSNFDQLAYTLETPPSFPEHLVIRGDAPIAAVPLDLMARHITPLSQPRGKELLLTPKGLRLVMLLAEADRARYGVFRQADFGGAAVDPVQLVKLIEHLVDLQRDILAWHDPAS